MARQSASQLRQERYKKTLLSTKERVVIQIHVMEIVCEQKLEHIGYIGHMDHIDLWT